MNFFQKTLCKVAFGRRLGIEEPQLMKIMRATLYSHKEWFKLQMCKDRFESLLKIDSLKEVSPTFFSAAPPSKSRGESCTTGSSQLTVSSGAAVPEDGSSPSQISSGDVVCDESAILKVMVSHAPRPLLGGIEQSSHALMFVYLCCHYIFNLFTE